MTFFLFEFNATLVDIKFYHIVNLVLTEYQTKDGLSKKLRLFEKYFSAPL